MAIDAFSKMASLYSLNIGYLKPSWAESLDLGSILGLGEKSGRASDMDNEARLDPYISTSRISAEQIKWASAPRSSMEAVTPLAFSAAVGEVVDVLRQQEGQASEPADAAKWRQALRLLSEFKANHDLAWQQAGALRQG
jgi:hypothetical protein